MDQLPHDILLSIMANEEVFHVLPLTCKKFSELARNIKFINGEDGEYLYSYFLVRGKKHGEYKKTFKNGKNFIVANYSMSKLDGKLETWYRTGDLCASGYYENGREHGTFNVFYRDPPNKLYSRFSYRHGRLHGLYEKFDPDGKLILRCDFVNGEPRGTFLDNACESKEIPVSNHISNWYELFLDGLQEDTEKFYVHNRRLFLKYKKQELFVRYFPNGDEAMKIFFDNNGQIYSVLELYPEGGMVENYTIFQRGKKIYESSWFPNKVLKSFRWVEC